MIDDQKTVRGSFISFYEKLIGGYERQLVLILATLFLFYVFRKFFLVDDQLIENANIRYALVFILSIGFLRIGYQEVEEPYRIVVRTILVLFVFYSITHHAFFSNDFLHSDFSRAFELNHARWLAAIAGVVGLFRPSLGIFCLSYTVWQKQKLSDVYGFSYPNVDYIPLVELGIFLIFGILLLSLARTDKKNKDFPTPAQSILLVAIAAHFANYFFSGLLKMRIAEMDPFFWALNNRTDIFMMVQAIQGVVPLSINESLYNGVFSAFSKLYVHSNFFVLFIQIAAIIGIIHRKAIIYLTLLYDLMHTVILLTTGIFFWKWIMLNLALVAAMIRFPKDALPWQFKVGLMLTVIGAPAFFTVAHLGWFDTRSYTDIYYVAITDNGQEYRVPVNYFMSGSVMVGQQTLGKAYGQFPPGHFMTGISGNTQNMDVMRQANACQMPVDSDARLGSGALAIVDRFIEQHHAAVLDNLDDRGRFSYDLFPHHIWSTPAVYREFNRLDKRKIVAYRYVVESICPYHSERGINVTVKKRSTHDIPLSRR